MIPARLPPVPSPAELAGVASTVDHLIVPDAALASAIRTHGDESSIATPESIVGGEELTQVDRLSSLIGEIDAPVGAVHRAIDRVVTSWRYLGSPTDLCVTPLEREVAALVSALDWPETALASAKPLDGSVAAVELAAFDPLQAGVLPEDTTIVTGDERPTAEHRVCETATTVVGEATAVIEDAGVAQVAMMADGAYRSHLEATIDTSSTTVGESDERDGWSMFIDLLNAAVAPTEARVGSVRRLLESLGVDLDAVDDHQRLETLDGETAVWLRTVTDHSAELTIGMLRDQLVFRSGMTLPTEPIETLDLEEAYPSLPAIRELRAYLRCRPVDRASPDSVEVVDPTSGWGTPRDTIVIVGTGSQWIRPPPPGLGDRWYRRECHRVAHLLSMGDRRVVLSTSSESPLAGWIEGAMVDTQAPSITSTPFPFTPEGRPRRGHDRFTKSRLNHLLMSPRDALYANLIPRPARRALTRGSAIHDYADLLVAAPAAIDSIGRDRIHRWVFEQLEAFVPERRHALLNSRLEAAMTVVEAYLEDLQPHPDALDGYQSPSWMRNAIAEAFEVALDRSVTEQYFVDRSLKISGVVDLIRTPEHLVDFKTGSPQTVESIVNRGRVPPTTRRADVQLPLYLAALRRRRPDRALTMTFVFCNGSLPPSLIGQPDLHALSRSVSYLPNSEHGELGSGQTVARLRAAVPSDHPRSRLASVIPTETIETAISDLAHGRESDAIVRELAAAGRHSGLEQATAEAGARSFVSAADRWRRTRMFSTEIDAFERFLSDWQERREGYDREGYPFGDPPEWRVEFPDLHPDQSPVIGGGD